MYSHSIDDIIRSRQWNEVLFTTYALSLTYFESSILPVLQQQGCQKIWVITDAKGYQNSLSERQSWKVGNEYWLIPAALKAGVFHPKCIYLSGPEGDLLLVGSGNLTFGGHGRNLEVFEVLAPETARQAFLDFAEFLETLNARKDFIIPNKKWFGTFTQHARTAAQSTANSTLEDEPRLIHSVDVPVINKIMAALTAFGSVSCIRILSPFYDSKGQAVRILLERTEAKKLEIGVLEKGITAFPFSRCESWPQKIEAVCPDLKNKRPLHAKWIEIKTAKALLLITGSINATTQALCTSNNIEVGVMRKLSSESSPLTWKKIKVTEERLNDALPAGLGTLELVHAAFDRNNNLYGELFSLLPSAGVWKGRLEPAHAPPYEFEAEVDDKGMFRIDYEELEPFPSGEAIQIVLTKQSRIARGWVHLDAQLGLEIPRGFTRSAITRLLSGQSNYDDINALLTYLVVSIREFSLLFDKPIDFESKNSSQADASENKNADRLIRLQELAPVDEHDMPAPNSLSSGDGLAQFMLQLRQKLISPTPLVTKWPQNFVGTADASEEDEEEEKQPPENPNLSDYFLYSLDDFERKMLEILNTPGLTPNDRLKILVIRFEVGMNIRLFHFEDLVKARRFLREWFNQACTVQGAIESLTPLEQYVVTAGCMLLLSEDIKNNSDVASGIHQSIAKFYGKSIDSKRAEAALIASPKFYFAQAFLNDRAVELHIALQVIMETSTYRHQLELLFDALKSGASISKDMPILQLPLGKDLLAILSVSFWERRIKQTKNEGVSCAICNHSFQVAEKNDIKKYGLAKCVYCSDITVDVKL